MKLQLLVPTYLALCLATPCLGKVKSSVPQDTWVITNFGSAARSLLWGTTPETENTLYVVPMITGSAGATLDKDTPVQIFQFNPRTGRQEQPQFTVAQIEKLLNTTFPDPFSSASDQEIIKENRTSALRATVQHDVVSVSFQLHKRKLTARDITYLKKQVELIVSDLNKILSNDDQVAIIDAWAKAQLYPAPSMYPSTMLKIMVTELPKISWMEGQEVPVETMDKLQPAPTLNLRIALQQANKAGASSTRTTLLAYLYDAQRRLQEGIIDFVLGEANALKLPEVTIDGAA